MTAAIQALLVALPPAYLVLAILYGMAFAGSAQPRFASARRPLLWMTLLAHASVFVLNASITGASVVGGARILSAVALTVGFLFCLVTFRSPQPTVAAILFALVFLLQLGASAFGPMGAESSVQAGNAVQTAHTITMLLATAALVLSGIYGLLHLVLYRQLKAQRFGPVVQRLPNLEQLARTTRLSALAGFVFLTLGVNVGIGLAHARNVEQFSYTDPTVLLNLGLWIHFGIIAFSKRVAGLTARRASFAAVGGLITLLIAIAILTVPGASFHAGS